MSQMRRWGPVRWSTALYQKDRLPARRPFGAVMAWQGDYLIVARPDPHGSYATAREAIDRARQRLKGQFVL
jgi:hypothetical protein